MRRKLFRSLLLGVAVVGLLSNIPVLSNPDSMVVQQVGEAQVALPDMESWTLGSMPGVEGGESPASFLNLGSLTSLGAEEFTLEQTAAYSGFDVNSLNLDRFPLASEQTLSNLVLGNGESQGVPYLGQYKIEKVGDRQPSPKQLSDRDC